MALTPDTWYALSFDAVANPPWATPNYDIPSTIVDAIVGASTIYCFCTADNGTYSTLVYKGGTAYIPTAAINVLLTPTMDTTVMDDGETWYSVRAGTAWQFYGTSSGVVKTLAAPTTLGAFIS